MTRDTMHTEPPQRHNTVYKHQNPYQSHAAQHDDEDDDDLKELVLDDAEAEPPEVSPDPPCSTGRVHDLEGTAL